MVYYVTYAVNCCVWYVQELIVNQSLLKRIDVMLVECEEKAVTCKQLNVKSWFSHFFTLCISWDSTNVNLAELNIIVQ